MNLRSGQELDSLRQGDIQSHGSQYAFLIRVSRMLVDNSNIFLPSKIIIIQSKNIKNNLNKKITEKALK